MRIPLVLATFAAVGLAGCGSSEHGSTPPPAPKLPRALALSWAQQADAVAASIEAGDGCTALSRATALRTQVVAAVNERRVPRRYLEPLVSTTNDLAGRIRCTPPAPAVVTSHGDEKPKDEKPPHDHGKHARHGKHGGGGD